MLIEIYREKEDSTLSELVEIFDNIDDLKGFMGSELAELESKMREDGLLCRCHDTYCKSDSNKKCSDTCPERYMFGECIAFVPFKEQVESFTRALDYIIVINGKKLPPLI